MPRENWYLKLEIEPWLNSPEVRRLSRADRSTWLDAILMMKREESYFISGVKKDLANQLHLTLDEFDVFLCEIKRTKVCDLRVSRTSVRIVSRRLQRELKARECERLKKERQRHPEIVPEVSPSSPAVSVTTELVTNKELREETPVREIFIGAVLAGVANNLAVKKLSMTAKNTWIQEADLAFDNGFKAEDFVTCHAERCERTTYSVKPEWVTDALPAFVKAKRKSNTLPSPEKLRQEDEEHRSLPLKRAPMIRDVECAATKAVWNISTPL